ncbi:hypothetical protein [Mesorhizobium sp.]|uniref:hypothetical protein n=1 Tax=Mesorhizobium sp. TaxID=1871066 RepID=UPI0025B8EC05|nr:hypothetical protein [Mesorhizobium sp.]
MFVLNLFPWRLVQQNGDDQALRPGCLTAFLAGFAAVLRLSPLDFASADGCAACPG